MKRRVFDGRVLLVGIIGLFLSVALHELFHIAMHWGYINAIRFMPTPDALVEIDAVMASDYDIKAEETVAYAITFAVILVTAIIMTKIVESRDQRTFSETLLPKWSSMNELESDELVDMAYNSGAFHSR